MLYKVAVTNELETGLIFNDPKFKKVLICIYNLVSCLSS